MDAQVSLKEKLDQFTNDERTIMAYIAKGYKYQKVADACKLDAPTMYAALLGLFKHFDLPVAKWNNSYEELARIGRATGFGEMSVSGSGATVLEAERDETDESTGERPTLEAVVERICTLGEVDAALLRASLASTKGDGSGEKLAQIAKVSLASLPSRMSTMYRRVGAPNFRGRKKFLQEALAAAEKKLRAIERTAARVQPVQPEKIPVPVVAVEPIRPAPREDVHGHASSRALSTAGHSAVIAIPATVEDADVVAGQFNGLHPAQGLEEQIQTRKRAGYKPSYLVLTTTNDPRVTQAQMVFLKHEGEK